MSDNNYDPECFKRSASLLKEGKRKSGRKIATHRKVDTNLESSIDSYFKLFRPIIIFEKIGVIFSLIVLGYLFYLSIAPYAKDEILKSIVGAIIFSLMFLITLKAKRIDTIVKEKTYDFMAQFRYDETRKTKIKIPDQANYLMDIIVDAFKYWKVSWLVYTIVVLILYRVAFYSAISAIILIGMIVIAVGYLYPKIVADLGEYFVKETKTIPPSPPHIGVMTLFDNALNYDLILDSGKVLVFPGVIDFIEINMKRQTIDFTELSGFYAKGIVPVKIRDFQIMVSPLIEYISEYIAVGGHDDVVDAIKNIISDKLKILIANSSYDDLIGREGDTNIIEKLQKDLLEELTGPVDEELLSQMRIKGIRDCHLLGILIFRLSISSVGTTEEYQQELDKLAGEDPQRRAETVDLETIILLADQLFARHETLGTGLTWDECFSRVTDDRHLRDGKEITLGMRGLLGRVDPVEIAKEIKEIAKLLMEAKK